LLGFYFIDNALTIDEQLYWAEECLTKLPTSQVPNPSNLDSHYGHIDIVNLFKTAYQLHSNCHSENVHHSKTLLNQLRWITLGYHYNWTQRTYDKNHYSPFPENLSELTVSLAKCVGYRIKPEAAIVNFYHFGPNTNS
jgi:alkylated DNA repair protein alkB family protein 1